MSYKEDPIGILRKYGAYKSKKSDVSDIKRQGIGLDQNETEVKEAKIIGTKADIKVVFHNPYTRVLGKNNMQKTRKILYSLRLRNVFSGVFVKGTEDVMGKLQKVEPYLTYGNWESMALYAQKISYTKLQMLVHISRRLFNLWDPLSKPTDILIKGKKQPYTEGGDAGNREDEINDLIS